MRPNSAIASSSRGQQQGNVSREARLAAPAYLNSRARTIFGGTDEVQKTILAKTVPGL